MARPREDAAALDAGAGESLGLAEPPVYAAPEPPEAEPATRSLLDDIEALIDDGRTYLDAELSYQKTRASFVSDRLKKTIAYAVVAAILALLAAIGLTVGLIIALTPILTGWGATAVVVGILLLAVFLLLRRASASWTSMMGAIHTDEGERNEDEG